MLYSVSAKRAFRCVDSVVADQAASTVKGRFQTLLSAGKQSHELPDGFLAAGQYLDMYDYSQRGLFGTAAAIRVLGHEPESSDRESVRKLIAYLDERPRIEREMSAGEEGEPGHTNTKLRTEAANTYKIADVLYSLCQAPAIIDKREKLIQEYALQLQSGRRASGGWSNSLEAQQGEPSLLATAHACRALHAAGLAISAEDLAIVREGLDTATAPVATFLLLTLIRVGDDATSKSAARQHARKLWGELKGRMDRPVELNVEITNTTDQDYVRVPWQIYLLECLLHTEPVRFLFSKSQRVVMAMVQALESTKGYVYEDSGSEQSTRTYSIVFDFLVQVRSVLRVNGVPRLAGSIINGASRVANSKTTFTILVVCIVALLAWASYDWFTDPQASFSNDVAPNIVASAILGVLAFAWFRLKRGK